MNPDLLRNNFFLNRIPPPPLPYTSNTNTPTSSILGNCTDYSSPETSPVKQTWEEFCREQEGIRLFTHTNFNSNGVPQSFKPSPSVSLDAYKLAQQVNNARAVANSTNRWQIRNSYRRTSEQEPLLKSAKKRKKPLSQNIPTKKEWALKDAERALLIETECNKRSKCSLIIKFPDLELNRDIVAGFHPDIDNVHFQQPSTPRFCFVTLRDSANVQEVITALNKRKFGDSYLVAEHKKDREEDQTVSARDVDPFTLYVGNLAQEITKEDMVQLYPKSRRIDIGYAKKMKYTRYAFVVFHTIDDAIDAFKRTHNHEIYNKSLIVRFRRLHGTVGMPGDAKQQNPPKLQSPEKKVTPQSIPEDIVEINYENNRISPFIINVKEEAPSNIDYDEDYCSYDDLPEINLSHHPKSIKLEVKSEIKPEVYEYGPDIKLGIKREFKQEQGFVEPEFNEYSDFDIEQDSDSYVQEEEFEDLFQTFSNQRKQASTLRSTML